jgi:hypothetical protein
MGVVWQVRVSALSRCHPRPCMRWPRPGDIQTDKSNHPHSLRFRLNPPSWFKTNIRSIRSYKVSRAIAGPSTADSLHPRPL